MSLLRLVIFNHLRTMGDAQNTVTPWIRHHAPKIDPAWAFAEAQRMRKEQIPDPPPR